MFYTPTDDSILEGYQNAKAVYASLGLDTERALAQFEKVGISIHSWAGDDVTGFETHEGGVHSENTVTGNYPGRARNGGELRQDLEQAMRFSPCTHPLLDAEPDFVIAEFSVNDESTGHFEETYEGLVRKILSSESHPALVLVHNVCYNNGASAELVHSRIARHYNIPSVSMQSTLYKALLNCRFDNRRITPDDLHPNDCGHELVSMVITKRLEQIKNTVKAEYETAKSQRAAAQPDAGAAALLPEPLTANAYEDSVRYRNYNSTPELDGFKADMSEQRDITDCFKKGYTASENGACITFKVKGSCIAVQFRRTIHKPAPVAVAVIDGDEANAVTLDANFDETWGDKLELYTLLEHGENKEHTVQIKLVKTSEADASEFYLVSIIASGR